MDSNTSNQIGHRRSTVNYPHLGVRKYQSMQKILDGCTLYI